MNRMHTHLQLAQALSIGTTINDSLVLRHCRISRQSSTHSGCSSRPHRMSRTTARTDISVGKRDRRAHAGMISPRTANSEQRRATWTDLDILIACLRELPDSMSGLKPWCFWTARSVSLGRRARYRGQTYFPWFSS
jgi:hypothetical protein